MGVFSSTLKTVRARFPFLIGADSPDVRPAPAVLGNAEFWGLVEETWSNGGVIYKAPEPAQPPAAPDVPRGQTRIENPPVPFKNLEFPGESPTPAVQAENPQPPAKRLPSDYYEYAPGEHPDDQPSAWSVEENIPPRAKDRWDTEIIPDEDKKPETRAPVEVKVPVGEKRWNFLVGKALRLKFGKKTLVEVPLSISVGRAVMGKVTVPGQEVPWGGVELSEEFYTRKPPVDSAVPESLRPRHLATDDESARYPRPKLTAARVGRGAVTGLAGTAVAAAAAATMISALSTGPTEGPVLDGAHQTGDVATETMGSTVDTVPAPQQVVPEDNGPSSWSAMPGDEGLHYSVEFDSRGDIQVKLCQAGGGEIEPAKKVQTRLDETRPSVAMSFVRFDQREAVAIDKNGLEQTAVCGTARWSLADRSAVPSMDAPELHTVGMTIGHGDGSRYIAVDVPSGAVTAVNEKTGQQVKKAPVKPTKAAGGKHRAGPKHRLHN